MGLSGSLWELSKSKKVKRNLPEAYESFQNLLDPYGSLWKLVEVSGSLWKVLETNRRF
jgi:hypothetical protein